MKRIETFILLFIHIFVIGCMIIAIGSGKTSLMSVISGSLNMDSGSVTVTPGGESEKDKNIHEVACSMHSLQTHSTFVHQSNAMMDNFSALQQVMYSIMLRHPMISLERARSAAVRRLHVIGLRTAIHKKVSSWLSGGEINTFFFSFFPA